MRLKMYIWHNPETEQPEKVYEFPWSEAAIHQISTYGRNMFSRKPMEQPILHIPFHYLTEIKNQQYSVSQDEIRAHQSQAQQEQ